MLRRNAATRLNRAHNRTGKIGEYGSLMLSLASFGAGFLTLADRLGCKPVMIWQQLATLLLT
jgi:hypothetical protein